MKKIVKVFATSFALPCVISLSACSDGGTQASPEPGITLHEREPQTGRLAKMNGGHVPYGTSVRVLGTESRNNTVWREVEVIPLRGWAPNRSIECETESNCRIRRNED